MNERAGTTGSAGMDEAAGTAGRTPMGAAEAAEIMADAAQRARRQFRVSHRVTFTVWGLGLRCSRSGAPWPMPVPARP